MNLNKKLIFSCITVILALLGYIIFTITDNINSNLEKNIKHVTQYTKIIDANIDHNQALDVYEYANKQGIKTPNILINFDTHSDIYLNQKVIHQDGAGIENWINEFIAKNPNVEEVYWVMPKEAALSLKMRVAFLYNNIREITWGFPLFGACFKKNTLTEIILPITIKPYISNYLINPKDGVLNEYVEDNELNDILFNKNIKYKKIKIITCTENTLPNFNGAEVFLSIDADYLSNSGYDTFEDFKNNKNERSIRKVYKSIFKTIREKNINPTIISLTLSPQYLPKEDHKQVLELFNNTFVTSKHKDTLSNYKRSHKGEGKKGNLRKNNN